MADYTPWDVNSLLPGEPWTSAKAIAAFENLDASFEGVSGAPRLYLRSLEQLTAGTSIRSRNDGPVGVTSGAGEDASTVAHQFDFMQFGTIRMTAQLTAAPSGTNLTFQRLRNGSSSTLATYTTVAVHSLDVSVLPGDRLSMVLFAGAGIVTITGQNFRLQTGGQDLWPGSSHRLEGNRTP